MPFMQTNSKVLLIRFSSFGDVTQALSLPAKIREAFPTAEIHWASRKEFHNLIANHPLVNKTWDLDRKTGIKGLIRFALELRKENFSHVYDAHNNFRSKIILLVLGFLKNIIILQRPTKRWFRFLLFNFRINKYEMPFSGQRDLIEPLTEWKITKSLPATPQIFASDKDQTKAKELLHSFANKYITLAPSAAYYLKRWPKNYWSQLIELLPDENFVLLGGPDDQFIEDIARIAPNRCFNLAGKCSLTENIPLIAGSKLLISNDTGLMHIAEQLGHACIALMGPAPFGFPSRPSTKIMQLDLKCRPCSKHGQGPCTNSKYHQCLVDITPEQIASIVKQWNN